MSHPARPTLGLGALALALLALCFGGCTTAPYCEPLGKCGGDLMAGATNNQIGEPENEWVATGPDSCTDQIQLPPNPVSLLQQPARTAGAKGIGAATVDWCSSLVQEANGTVRFTPFFPIIPVRQVTLALTRGHYNAHIVGFAPQQMAFPASCRAAQGIAESCPTLGRHIKEAIAAEANVYNTRCYDDGEGGCLCDYELSLLGGAPGTWAVSGSTVTFYDQSNTPSPPAPADFCLKGDSLELTGHNGQQLFNKTGLRTLTFRRPTCNDGVQSHGLGETGVDCGGQCGPCSTCKDGAQNGDEEGVDCGGSCPDFCGCFNKVQDPWEEGVDCGGPCALLCTCTDGVKNGNEQGVDCGGDCVLRTSEKASIACK